MKNLKTVFLWGALMCSLSVLSQVNYDATRNNTELENKIEREKRKEAFEKEKLKYVQQTIQQLKIDLALNELQFIAIEQIINTSIKTEGIILKKEDSDESKRKEIEALTLTTETKIKALLSPEQIMKYDELKNKLPEKKNRKKKK